MQTSENQVPNTTVSDKAFGAYTAPKESNTIDLVKCVELQLTFQISSLAASVFINNPMIQDIKDKAEDIQRMIINRYFAQLLFAHRTTSGTTVLPGIGLIMNDALTDDWIKIMVEVFIPYLKINQIMY